MVSLSNPDYLEDDDMKSLLRLVVIDGCDEHIVFLNNDKALDPKSTKSHGYELRPECIEWLRENTEGEFRARATEIKTKVRDLMDNEPFFSCFEGKVYYVAFEKQNDAFHFKMRWT